METIKEANKNIALLWRRPKPLQELYRPMKYLLYAQVDDGLLVYNIVTSEMILLSDPEKRLFEGTPTEYCEGMEELIARHFLVVEHFDESKSVRELRALINKLRPSKRVYGFTILPTTECNARCYYCFQSDFVHCTMTDKIVTDVIEYIAKQCDGKPVDLNWFGGEPLVGKKQISAICSGLQEKSIQFRSTMVSNAYLFDSELVHIAKKDWHLSGVQITLDGTEEVYNKTKAYVNPGENPFQRVIRNINLLLENDISVAIRLNVTDRNYEDLNTLIDELEDAFAGRKGFSGYAHAVYEGVGFDPLTYDNRTFIDEQTVALDAKIKKAGFGGSFGKLPELRTIHCMADNESTRLIYPDGKIGKCENKSSADCIGDIYEDIIDATKKVWYKSYIQSQDCYDCPIYPNCISLACCPETGKCSRPKQSWKMDCYTRLVERYYQNHKKQLINTEPEAINQSECES